MNQHDRILAERIVLANDLVATDDEVRRTYDRIIERRKLHPPRQSEAVFVFLETYDGTLSFLQDVRDKYAQYGRLSDPQLAAVQRCFLQEQQSLAGRSTESAADLAPPAVPPGYYTVDVEKFGHVTLRIRIGRQGRSKDKPVIGYLSGHSNVTSYTGVGYVDGADVRRFRTTDETGPVPARVDAAIAYLLSHGDDFEYFGKAYALTSGNCWKCSKLLTDPASISLGIGPDCRKKQGTISWDDI